MSFSIPNVSHPKNEERLFHLMTNLILLCLEKIKSLDPTIGCLSIDNIKNKMEQLIHNNNHRELNKFYLFMKLRSIENL